MKALLTILPVAGALAACQTATLGQLGYRAPLDRIRIAAPVDPDEGSPEGQQPALRAVSLHEQSGALRMRLASDPDRTQRIGILQQLQELGDTQPRLEASGSLHFLPRHAPDGPDGPDGAS